MNLILIHVAKCGGLNLLHKIEKNHNIKIKEIHEHHYQKHIKKIYNNNKNEYILLLRDPITRFISGFFYWFKLYKKFINTGKVFKKIKDSHYYTIKLYHKKKFFEFFDTPNKLAESLDSSNNTIKNLGNKFMRNIKLNNHGFFYYLINKKFINLIYPRIKYVIKQEKYNDDFNLFYDNFCKDMNLKKKNLNLDKIINNTNEFNNLKFLSDRAKKNLKSYFKRDYKILKYLVKKNIITQDYYDSFL